MTKTLLLIPGFGENTKEKPYQEINKYAKSIGYTEIVEVNPKWVNRTASDWCDDVKNIISLLDQNKTTVVAFSFGAYISLILAENLNFKKVIFCSFSPYFKEHLNHIPKVAKDFLGKKRIDDFNNYSLPSKLSSVKNIFLFGDKDWPYAIKEALKYSNLQKGRFILVKNTEHELNKAYLETIFKLLK
jgi:esterase/lipase